MQQHCSFSSSLPRSLSLSLSLSPQFKALGVNVTTNNKDIVLNSDVIVLAVKPHQILGVLDELQKIYKELSDDTVLTGTGPTPKNLRPLVISVATAITIKQIEEKVSDSNY